MEIKKYKKRELTKFREALKENPRRPREFFLAYAFARGVPYRTLERTTEWDKNELYELGAITADILSLRIFKNIFKYSPQFQDLKEEEVWNPIYLWPQGKDYKGIHQKIKEWIQADNPPRKLYIAVRNDLTPGQQLAQSVHAIREFSENAPLASDKWYKESNTIVCLGLTPDEMNELERSAKLNRVRVVRFYEPDLQNIRTALCLVPSRRNAALCAGFPLALSGKRKLLRMAAG